MKTAEEYAAEIECPDGANIEPHIAKVVRAAQRDALEWVRGEIDSQWPEADEEYYERNPSRDIGRVLEFEETINGKIEEVGRP